MLLIYIVVTGLCVSISGLIYENNIYEEKISFYNKNYSNDINIEKRIEIIKKLNDNSNPFDFIHEKDILEKLHFGVKQNGKNWVITPTSQRVDIVIPENIVSELVRIYGYDKIGFQEIKLLIFLQIRQAP